MMPPLLESPQLLQVVWPDTDGTHLGVAVAPASGAASERQVAALPPARDPLAAQPIRTITDGLAEGWRTVLDGAPQIPLALREPERVAFSAPLDGGGLYVRINANGDDANGPLQSQLARIADGRPTDGWSRIVLDLRFNDGGDELKTAAFTRALPRLLATRGQLWILMDNATFSAAIITAARAKVFVGARAHIVGERAGDRGRFWTDGGPPLALRNSGIAIGHAYFLQDWTNGCRSVRYCLPTQFIYGVAAGDLDPEITIGWRFADYAAGRDTVLERVMELSAPR
jgi:hypothetical protein